MKLAPKLKLLAMAATAITQASQFYRSADGNIVMHFRNFEYRAKADGSQEYSMVGGVTALDRLQGLTVSATRVRADFGPHAATTSLRTLDAVGNVRLVKTSIQQGVRKVVTIDSPKVHYAAGTASCTASVTGPVRLKEVVVAPSNQTLVATGDHGLVVLSPKVSGRANPLRTALLTGHARVVLLQAPSRGASAGRLIVTGDTLTVDNTSVSPTVTMRGHVTVHGENAAMNGMMGGANVVVMHIDATGKVSSIDAGGGA